jgi:hypothetical protein
MNQVVIRTSLPSRRTSSDIIAGESVGAKESLIRRRPWLRASCDALAAGKMISILRNAADQKGHAPLHGCMSRRSPNATTEEGAKHPDLFTRKVFGVWEIFDWP